MDNFAGMPQEKFDEIETVRPSIDQETKSYFDETLEDAMVKLGAEQRFRLSDTINRLDNNKTADKEALANVLNMNGKDWTIFSSLATDAEAEKAMSMMIVEWAQDVEKSADRTAIAAAGKRLADKIEAF